MSCSRNQRVLRVACAKYGIEDPYEYLKERIGEITWDEYSFCPSLAGSKYIDYILHDQPLQYSIYEPFDNTWQCLSPYEAERYRPLFEEIIPDIDMEDVVMVESCWYDGVEAPDIYRPDDAHYETFHVTCVRCHNSIAIHDPKKHTKGTVTCPDCGGVVKYSRYWGLISCEMAEDD